jgi:hypothetical protein
VKYIDGISELGNVDDPERPGCVTNPNFLRTLAHGVHGLPVVRLLAVLNLIELMTCLAPGRKRKGAKIIKGTAPELDGFGNAYTTYCMPQQAGIRASGAGNRLGVLDSPFSEATPDRKQLLAWRMGLRDHQARRTVHARRPVASLAGGGTMLKIFVSYRRSDSQMVAGRLRESLAMRLGDEAIFRDKDSIGAGRTGPELSRPA